MTLVPTAPAHWIGLYALAGLGGLWLLIACLRMVRSWIRHRDRPSAVSFLLLVRNREHQIEGILRSLGYIMRSHRLARSDLVVVDCCSEDETPRIIERLAPEVGNLRLVRLSEHVCRGQVACEVGLLACRNRVVVLLDLLGSTSARPLLQAVASLVGVRGPLWWI